VKASSVRVPRLHGPLAAPRNFHDVLARALVLSRAHSAAFDDATPTEVVQAVFAGWTLCGVRRGEPGRSRQVHVLRRGAHWFGFGFFAETTKPQPPKTPRPDEMVNYLALLRDHRDRMPWYSLNGAARLERVRLALTSDKSLDGPISALSAVEVLEIANERAGLLFRVAGPNNADYMSDILLTDDMTDDADGTLAVARTMAGLGRYSKLEPTPADR
jgi:hypothetical protein